MSIVTVRADWIEEQVFLLRDHSDFPVVMTQPQGVSGADLLPMSLIGCVSWDIISILRKQRQPVARLTVFADCQQAEEPPWRFTQIHIRYRFTGHELEAARVEHAVDLSEQKYCAVYATLRLAVELTRSIEIVDE